MFLLKIIVTPLLVAGMSLVAKRFGPTVGGLIMGLPWMTAPVLFFLGLEKGEGWLAAACLGALTAVIAIAAFILAYGLAARLGPWPVSLLAAVAAFTAVAGITQAVRPGIWLAGIAGPVALLAGRALLPRPLSAVGPRPLPWWDIPMRMVATAVLVTVVALIADAIGPGLSGVVASFPVILTAIGCFTHARWGADAVLQILRAISLSLLSFVAFFVVLTLSLPGHGLIMAFVLSTLAGLAVSACLVAGARITATGSKE